MKKMSKINEYPEVKKQVTNYEVATKTLLGKVEFCDSGVFIAVRDNEENGEKRINAYLDNSEQLNDLAVIISKINSLNIEE